MKTHTTLENLSAYIDGEAKNADQVRAHLQQCAECAQRHLALAKISTDIQALPAPELRAGFAERVVATLEDGEAYRQRPWWQTVGAPVAMAATLLLAAGLFAAQRGMESTILIGEELPLVIGSAPETVPQDSSSDSTDTWNNSDWIMASAQEAEQEDTETEDLLLVLAGVPWFESSETYFDNGRDMDVALAAIYSDQPEAVLEALTSYARSRDPK
jgi:hypothetical protein